MARVYRARDTRLNRIVALKVLGPEHAAEPETRQRFQNEATSAAQLDHENIARVYYIGEDRGIPFIVYEYIEGTNLRAMVEQRGPLPLAEAVHYTLQIAEALSHAASRNIVHRDIKPSNILITPEGRAKLIDLGLARIHQPLTGRQDLTATGVTLGTFDYIAPEQARDPRTADVRSDIYSLGCAFFFMLVGRPPFPEGTVLQKLLQHQTEQPPDPRIWRPELPELAIRILRNMLAKDPADRYQHPEELVADLLALAELVGAPAAGRPRTVWITSRHGRTWYLERHLPWLIPLAALFAGVMVLDWLWSTGSQPEGMPPERTSLEANLPSPATPPASSAFASHSLEKLEKNPGGALSAEGSGKQLGEKTFPAPGSEQPSVSSENAQSISKPQPPSLPANGSPSSPSGQEGQERRVEGLSSEGPHLGPERFHGELSGAEGVVSEIRGDLDPQK